MDRNTNLRNMSAPPVGSGKDAKETVLKAEAVKTSSEKEGNPQEAYTVSGVPGKGNLGGRAKF